MYQHFYYSIFIWSLTCFGRHTAYHQEPKTALVASGFSYVEGCWTCSWWTTSTNYLLHNGVRRGVGLKGEGKPYFKIYFFVTSALRLAAMLFYTYTVLRCHSPILFYKAIVTLKTLDAVVNIVSAHHVLYITGGPPPPSNSMISGPILIINKVTTRSFKILPSVRRL